MATLNRLSLDLRHTISYKLSELQEYIPNGGSFEQTKSWKKKKSKECDH
jgi:hypothetical protein